MKEVLKRVVKNLLYLKQALDRKQRLLLEKGDLIEQKDHLIARKNEQLKQLSQEWKTRVPPGHFYSPIPSLEEVQQKEQRCPDLFTRMPEVIPGVTLNQERQLKLLDVFQEFYRELPFHEKQQPHLRYFFENPSYSYSDAIFLYSIIRYAKPKRIVEVGSGYSSCVILDTNDLFFEGSIACTFIEPYPDLLQSLIRDGDRSCTEILPQKLQEIPLEKFVALEAGDILFIDSTHVSKFDSDVNHIFFNILPRLKSGVYIHFHDVFYPFEYPKAWIYEGRAWNEDYLLRAFLQYNSQFEIVAFNTFLEHFYEEYFQQNMPLCLKNRGGSIWLRKM